MKLLVFTITALGLLLTSVGHAKDSSTGEKKSCSYSLDGEAYVGKDDGDLIYGGQKYRCITIQVGNSERNFCKKNPRSKRYDLVVSFDGAENDFYVWEGLDPDPYLCHGVATEKKH